MTTETLSPAPSTVLLDPGSAHRHSTRCYWSVERCGWECREPDDASRTSPPTAGAEAFALIA